MSESVLKISALLKSSNSSSSTLEELEGVGSLVTLNLLRSVAESMENDDELWAAVQFTGAGTKGSVKVSNKESVSVTVGT